MEGFLVSNLLSSWGLFCWCSRSSFALCWCSRSSGVITGWGSCLFVAASSCWHVVKEHDVSPLSTVLKKKTEDRLVVFLNNIQFLLNEELYNYFNTLEYFCPAQKVFYV